MELVKIIQKQMIELNIDGNKGLEAHSGISYDIILRLMKGGKSIKLKDLNVITKSLGITLKFVIEGGEQC